MADEVTISSASSGSTTRTLPTMDPTHVYYLHSSNSPGMALVSTPFDGKGYQGWKRSVLIALSAKNKLDFITGANASPDAQSPDLRSWSRCNDMRLWDELESLKSDKCTCVCNCEGEVKQERSLEDEKLIQFLIGLNDLYAQARGNILMMNPLPNINVQIRENVVLSGEKGDSEHKMDMDLINQHFTKEQFKHFIQMQLLGPLIKRPQAFGEVKEGPYLIQIIPKDSSGNQEIYKDSKVFSNFNSTVSGPSSVSHCFPVCFNVNSNVRL
ncbi:hypothetical protein P3S68_033044 [Capsicum galapagoense]